MEELGELGFNCAVLGLDTVMHAAKAIETVLLDMKSGKFARRNDGMDFESYKKLVGYDKWEFDRRSLCAEVRAALWWPPLGPKRDTNKGTLRHTAVTLTRPYMSR